MDSDIPVWVKVFALFVAVACVFFVAAWRMIVDWISDTAKRLLSNNKPEA